MDDERYKALMKQLGMPNSRSLLLALQQVANEVGQEKEADNERLREELDAMEDENEGLRDERDWYKRRFEALQTAQKNMRDPERKAVCDILANGKTYALRGEN